MIIEGLTGIFLEEPAEMELRETHALRSQVEGDILGVVRIQVLEEILHSDFVELLCCHRDILS